MNGPDRSRDSATEAASNVASWFRSHWPAVALATTFVVTCCVLRWEGRRWFCECGEFRVWISDARGSHTSQHLADPYSFSHLQHGLVLFWAFAWIMPGQAASLRLWLATLVECGWEILENSAWVINRYRETTAALGYEGDSVVNSIGDILCCVGGVFLAQRLGWRRSVALFVVIEATMIIAIRDSLLLNVLMLAWPIEDIQQWQLAAR